MDKRCSAPKSGADRAKSPYPASSTDAIKAMHRLLIHDRKKDQGVANTFEVLCIVG